MTEEVTREEIEALGERVKQFTPMRLFVPHLVDDLWNTVRALAASQSRPTKEAAPEDLIAQLEDRSRWLRENLPARFPSIDLSEAADEIDSAVAALRASTKDVAPSASGRGMVAEGWVLVPKEPTEEMMSAGMSPFLAAHDLLYCKNEPTGPIYRAMLASAPAPSPDNGWLDIKLAPPDEICDFWLDWAEGCGGGKPFPDDWRRFRGKRSRWSSVCCAIYFRPLPPPPAALSSAPAHLEAATPPAEGDER